MFSVNIDKIVNMTEIEENSYQEIVETFLDECGDTCRTIAIIGGGVKAFKIASLIMKKDNKVLFIDGDMQNEAFLGKYKLGKNLNGIMDYMINENSQPEDLSKMVCVTNHDNMNIVFTGILEDDFVSLEEEEKMNQILEKYRGNYDFIVVDSDENGNIAKYCDGTLVVIDEEEYSEASADDFVNELDNNGCHVLGVIINE